MLKVYSQILYFVFFICYISCKMENNSESSLEFHLQKKNLTEIQPYLYDLWTRIQVSSKSVEDLDGIPQDLSSIEYISLKISDAPDSIISGLLGIDNLGNEVFYFDTNNDENLKNESPVTFVHDDSGKTQTVDVQFDELINGKVNSRDILIELFKDDQWFDFHIVNYWESEVVFETDTLKSGILRFPPANPIMFMDSDNDGIYNKHFGSDAERVALGGKFYRIQIDLPAEKITFIETDDRPVDLGYPAPIFSGQIYQSKDSFNLEQELGKVNVVYFSSAYCKGTKHSMPTIQQISEEFSNTYEVNFISIAQDSSETREYYTRFNFPFNTIIDYGIWKDYGVISTPTLFITGKNNNIQYRGNIPDIKVLSDKINNLL